MTKLLKSAPDSMATDFSPRKDHLHTDIRFVVPMPGKASYHQQPAHFPATQICKFSHQTGNLAMEDFRAQFLMEREYPID